MNILTGVLSLYSVPKALANDALKVIQDARIRIKPHEWQIQPLVLGSVATKVELQASESAFAELTASLAQVPAIRFELTIGLSVSCPRHRWAFTPGLGIFSAPLDEFGNILVNEIQLRQILYGSGNDLLITQAGIRRLLGTAWDDDLERFRAQEFRAVGITNPLVGWG